MFKSIVVGLDGSEASDNALRVACDIAQKYGSQLHLVHTPQPQTVAFAMGAVASYHTVTTMPHDAEVTEAANKIIDAGTKIAQDCGVTDVKSHTNRGNPVEEIITCANDCGADLIVTGRRGLGNLSALVLGSTSLAVCHAASCAVLSVA